MLRQTFCMNSLELKRPRIYTWTKHARGAVANHTRVTRGFPLFPHCFFLQGLTGTHVYANSCKLNYFKCRGTSGLKRCDTDYCNSSWITSTHPENLSFIAAEKQPLHQRTTTLAVNRCLEHDHITGIWQDKTPIYKA